MSKSHSKWTSLLITCKSKQYAEAVQRQVDIKQKLGTLPSDLDVLCIEDPQDGIGSGGATLNALLILTEHLSARNGYTVVTSDVLASARILVVHFGRYFPYDACGRSLVSLPLVPEQGELCGLVTNFDSLFDLVTNKLASNSPPGMWVCSSDMLLNIPDGTTLNWKKLSVGDGVLCVSVPGTVDYATKHGVYCIDHQNSVTDLLFRGSHDAISKCIYQENVVALVTGVVFFSTHATEMLLATHVTPPLDACTYLGIDSGMDPLGLSLFFDILLPMASSVSEDEFIRGKRSGRYGQVTKKQTTAHKQLMQNARSILWRQLRKVPLKGVIIEGGQHCYIDMTESPKVYWNNILSISSCSGFKPHNIVHSSVADSAKIGQNVLLINSIVESGADIGDNTCLVHCHVTKNTKIGRNCYVYGLNNTSCENLVASNIPSDSTVLGMSVKFCNQQTRRIFAALKADDQLLGIIEDTDQSVNRLPENLYENKVVTVPRRYVLSSAISGCHPLPLSYRNLVSKKDAEQHKNTLFMARLFPVFHPHHSIGLPQVFKILNETLTQQDFRSWSDCWRCSLCEMLEHVDYNDELNHQEALFLEISLTKIGKILLENINISLLPLLNAFVAAKHHEKLLDFLDRVAMEAVSDENVQKRPDISARCFACIADVLGVMAGPKAVLRSGPAANKEWQQPLALLEEGEIGNGICNLAAVREKWLNHPDLLIRASRHYEGAEQILIRHAVKSAMEFIRTVKCNELPFDTWYCAECPARIDLSGGWTDTPPICYEFGGSVVNVAILLNGKRPIGARIRKIKSPKIILCLLGETESDTQVVECSVMEQMLNYYQPQVTGALLKACCILAGIIDPKSSSSLQDQLINKHGSGFELQTWSKLPRGSGLGTSSILAAAVMAVLYRASGFTVDADSLLHSVLVVEQMLTTGGGWQDQVGGILGGIKIGRSAPSLPLQITSEVVSASDSFYAKFRDHLKIIYTGKTRLARNLLQNVLRNWYTKRKDIMENCSDLRKNAEDCLAAFNEQNLEAIGRHINRYWEQKKVMASGCEPDLCTRMMEKFRPFTFGQALCGAGGGGFMYIVTKEPMSTQNVMDLLGEVDGAQGAEVYEVEIDRVGIVCHTTTCD